MMKIRIIIKIARILIRLYLRKKYGGKAIGFGNLSYKLDEMTQDDNEKLSGLKGLFDKFTKD